MAKVKKTCRTRVKRGKVKYTGLYKKMSQKGKMMPSGEQEKEISAKIERIMQEGVRRNTHKPVGKGNPRRPVSPKQAQAIAYSMVMRNSKK
jgi:hypothetical protein